MYIHMCILVHRAAPRSYIHMRICTLHNSYIHMHLFFFIFLFFYFFIFFLIFFFIFSDSRLAVVQPGYAVCCSHWLPLRMFPVIAAMKSWRAFWCIVSLSSTGISNPVCTMFNIINFLFFIFYFLFFIFYFFL